MGLDNAHYYGWHGTLRSPWMATLAIVRVALLQVFRRKSYWIVIALGVFQFLAFWIVIYAVTQARLPQQAQRELYEVLGFSADPPPGEDNGYINFMRQQAVVVMILLAFSGSLLVGSDFRMKSLPFYLSRRIDRRHYIVGKLLAVSAIISLLTTIPALLLFLEYGMFTASLEYWRTNWTIVLDVLAYGAMLCLVLSILLVALSAYAQRVVPIAIVWSSAFVLLGRLAEYLRDASGQDAWQLLDLWYDIRAASRLLFGTFADDVDHRLALQAAGVLAVVCSLALFALVRRVRAVDIVE